LVLALEEQGPQDGTGQGERNPARRLTGFLAEKLGRNDVRMIACDRLGGGAVQENWRIVLEYGGQGRSHRENCVLRTAAKTSLPGSRPKSEEFALLQAVWQAGIQVPEPLWLCEDPGVIGAPFLIVREIPGTAVGGAITALNKGPDGNPPLLRELGRELAKIHDIRVLPPALSFLDQPPCQSSGPSPAEAAIGHWRGQLDRLSGDWPVLEWGLRWCEAHLPSLSRAPCLLHGDFRTGNYMVAGNRLTGVLDWEFAQWGDPMSDIGWFCAACWRFDRPELEAGGIGRRSAFYDAYEGMTGQPIDPVAVKFWEVLSHIRWAIIAVQQGVRFFEGGEDSLDLALTGRLRPAQVQLQLLEMTAPEHWSSRRQRIAADSHNRRHPEPDRRTDMADHEETAELLASAAALFQSKVEPSLPPEQQDNGRMIREALLCALADLKPASHQRNAERQGRNSLLAAQLREGEEDGRETTHLALLEAISEELNLRT
jgi:aminoglycoside phosphotransferase (APT) family kinase protein